MPALTGVLSIERLQVQAFRQAGSRNPRDRVLAQKGPKEGDYGEACTMGSCFEGSSTRWGLDLAESSPNSPNWTQEWHEAVGPKNAEKARNGRGSPPQNPTEGRCGSALTFAQAKTLRTAEEEEEEAWSTDGPSTPAGRRRRCDLHAAPRHASTPPEARRRSHLQNTSRKW